MANPVLLKNGVPVECLMVGVDGHILFQGRLEKLQTVRTIVFGGHDVVLAINNSSHPTDDFSRIHKNSSSVHMRTILHAINVNLQ